MKLKPDFVPMDIDETSYLVPVGGISFQGVVRGNETAGAILKCLREPGKGMFVIPFLRNPFPERLPRPRKS